LKTELTAGIHFFVYKYEGILFTVNINKQFPSLSFAAVIKQVGLFIPGEIQEIPIIMEHRTALCIRINLSHIVDVIYDLLVLSIPLIVKKKNNLRTRAQGT
jgi:hypothetical protein